MADAFYTTSLAQAVLRDTGSNAVTTDTLSDDDEVGSGSDDFPVHKLEGNDSNSWEFTYLFPLPIAVIRGRFQTQVNDFRIKYHLNEVPSGGSGLELDLIENDWPGDGTASANTVVSGSGSISQSDLSTGDDQEVAWTPDATRFTLTSKNTYHARVRLSGDGTTNGDFRLYLGVLWDLNTA